MTERVKLTEAQRTALAALCAETAWASSYSMGLSQTTLKSLEKRGLALAKCGVGSMFSPRTAIKWAATDAGRATLKAQENEPRGA